MFTTSTVSIIIISLKHCGMYYERFVDGEKVHYKYRRVIQVYPLWATLVALITTSLMRIHLHDNEK